MNLWLSIGAVNGFLAVAFGAFGAHGLEGRVDAHAMEIFNTGAHYHLTHALAGVGAALAATGVHKSRAEAAAALFAIGTLLFSGSLYFMALTGSNALVLATPLGGLCLLAGWAMLAFAALKRSA